MVELEYVGKHRPLGRYEVKDGQVKELVKSGEWLDPGLKRVFSRKELKAPKKKE